MSWSVRFHEDFDPEFDDLPAEVQEELLANAKLLETFGPAEKRREVAVTTLKERMEKLPKGRRERVEARAAVLIAEEMSLRDLRKARKRTQVRVAKELGIKQENVSRIERRADLLISTLNTYVEAMGGKLHLVAEFPDRPPIALTGIGALDEDARPPKR